MCSYEAGFKKGTIRCNDLAVNDSGALSGCSGSILYLACSGRTAGQRNTGNGGEAFWEAVQNMSDILYLKIAKNIEVCHRDVFLSDVSNMECSNRDILSKVKAIRLIRIPDQKNNRYVFSVLKVIEEIHKIYPKLEIQNLGEIDFIIDYEAPGKQSPLLRWGKFILIWLITFCGAVFSILTFHNDVGLSDIFDEIYRRVMGEDAAGYTILEIAYSIGLVVGIMVFYNHFGKKRVTTDPTPVEVEMRLYEDDINKTLIEGVNRKDRHIEVD